HQIPSSHPAYLSAHIQERASRGNDLRGDARGDRDPPARPSSASGGSSVERLPIASKKLATTSSLSRACRRASGEAQEQRTRSSVCTKSSSGGLRRRPCCRRPIRRQCCSGRCSPLVKSTCARLTGGRPSPPHNKAINRLTSPPDSGLSKCRRSRHQIPTQFATPPTDRHFFSEAPLVG